MEKAMIINANNKRWQLLASVVLILVIVLPMLSFAKSRPQLYVDAKVSTSGNGSVSKPYKTISEAISKAKKNSEIHVANGTYKENIKLSKGVSIFGASKDSVIITAKNTNEPTVIMKDETKIDKVTIKKGEVGVRVDSDSKASIINCVITDNDRDGIKIKDGGTENSNKVSISKSTIKNNGKAGIYSERRRVILMDSIIRNNNKDGVVFAKGVSAWVEDNDIFSNERSGMVATLDQSDIWTKDNTFRNNHDQAVEINAYGESGRVDINKSEFRNNEGFGISRIARVQMNQRVWSGLTQENNKFDGNTRADVSPIFTVLK